MNQAQQTSDSRKASQLAVMEGNGAYNRNALRPGAGGALALPVLEKAARVVDLGSADRPLLIADYGSSQGRNSLNPMRAAITVLRDRIGPDRPISVVHTDLPGNDFSTLFHTLHTDPGSYLRAQPNIFPSAVGRSFYESVLPPGQVSLGWSSYAAMWLSRIPTQITGHYWSQRAIGKEREAFDRQAEADWLTFLSLRARELRPSGRLVIVLAALDEDDQHGAEPIHDAANDCLSELVARGTISAAERTRMIVPGRIRGRTQLLAPFAADGMFDGLAVEHCEVSKLPEAAWNQYLENGNAQMLATARAGFFRSVFVPSLAEAIDSDKPPAAKLAFADELEAMLVSRLAGVLREIPATAAIMVVARQAV